MEVVKSTAIQKNQPANGALREEAELRKAIRVARRECGPEHVTVALSHLRLGDFHIGEQQFPEAEAAYRSAAEIYDALGIGHELLHAIALRSLAQAICSQERDAEAAAINYKAMQLILNYQ